MRTTNKAPRKEPEWVSAKDLFDAPVEIGDYLIIHPGICHGKMTFKGTRVPVQTVLTFLGMGKSMGYIRKGWPRVPREAVEEAIKIAAAGWPELLRAPYDLIINRLASALATKKMRGASLIDEPSRPRRTA